MKGSVAWNLGPSLLALGAGLVVAGPAHAQAGAKCPAPGTEFKFSNSEDLMIAEQDLGRYVCRYKNSRTGATIDRILIFNTTSVLFKPNLDKMRSLIPLEVGKKTSFLNSGASVTGGDGTWEHTISVESREEVTVPAGRFPCLVILHSDTTTAGSSRGRWERRWCFSPAVGYAVNFEYRTIHGSPPSNYPKNWQLVSVRAP